MQSNDDFLKNYSKNRKKATRKKRRYRIGDGIFFGDIRALQQYFNED